MISGIQVNSRGHRGEDEWDVPGGVLGYVPQKPRLGPHPLTGFQVNLVRNRSILSFGRRRGNGVAYEQWLARCCDLLLYLTGRRWTAYDWYGAYHKRRMTVAEAVNDAIGRQELEVEEVPLREHPVTVEEAVEEI